jgi:hypothetical protein
MSIPERILRLVVEGTRECTAFADAQREWERRRRERAAEDGPFA